MNIQLKTYYALLFLSIHSIAQCTYYANQPDFSRSLDCKQIEVDMADAEVTATVCIDKCNSAPVYLLTLSNGLQVVFKPRGNLHNVAEVAAYRASKFLKQNLVPPTILRTINNQEGSLQLYIKPAKTMNFDGLSQKDISDIMVYSFIFGKFDWNKNRNFIITKSNNVGLIDNCAISRLQEVKYGSLCFWKDSETILPKMEYENTASSFPFHKAQKLTAENLKKYHLPQERIHHMLGSSWRKSFVFYKNNLWFQSDSSVFVTTFTKTYSKATLKAYKKLDENLLQKIWNVNNFYTDHKELCDELFEKVMDRKHQLLAAAKKGKLMH